MSTPVTGYPAYPYSNASSSSSSSNPPTASSTSIASYPTIQSYSSTYSPSAPPVPPSSSSSSASYSSPYVVNPSNQPLQGYQAPPPSTGDKVFKTIGDATRTVSHKLNNVVKHLSSGKSIPETALGKLHNLSLIIPGEAENTWRKVFQTPTTDRLLSYYACLLSTSVGAIPGTLYVSYQFLSFYSDRPINASSAPGVQVQSHYKVIIPTQRVSQINSTTHPQKPQDKYIQVITVDNHEFWFLGFISFSDALKTMKIAHSSNLRGI